LSITFRVKTDFDLDKTVGRIIREISNDLTKELRSRTPIDTGKARRGWREHISRRKATVKNKVEYISALEDGHSKQAPQGFVNQSINKIKRNARSGKYKQRTNK
jgi:hypothetical protein